MTAHPQENPDAYEGADMDAEMDARKRGCMTDAGKAAERMQEGGRRRRQERRQRGCMTDAGKDAERRQEGVRKEAGNGGRKAAGKGGKKGGRKEA